NLFARIKERFFRKSANPHRDLFYLRRFGNLCFRPCVQSEWAIFGINRSASAFYPENPLSWILWKRPHENLGLSINSSDCSSNANIHFWGRSFWSSSFFESALE